MGVFAHKIILELHNRELKLSSKMQANNRHKKMPKGTLHSLVVMLLILLFLDLDDINVLVGRPRSVGS